MIQITDKQSQKCKKNIAGPCITSYPLRVVQELTIGERWVPAEYFFKWVRGSGSVSRPVAL